MIITNGEKYKTPKERFEAFERFCCAKQGGRCVECPLAEGGIPPPCPRTACAFAWEELEYEPEIFPCPFCGGECRTIEDKCGGHVVGCDSCCYCSRDFDSDSKAIEAHNRLVCAVKKGEAK